MKYIKYDTKEKNDSAFVFKPSFFQIGAREIKGELSSFFTASHPNILPSSAIPLTQHIIIYGNTGRGKKEIFWVYTPFSSHSLLSLLGYKIIGRNGCTLMSSLLPPTIFCGISDASSHLSIFGGFLNV